MSMTREKIVALYQLFNRLAAQKTTVKFHFLVAKNKRLMEPEVKSIQDANEPTAEFLEFEGKRVELCNDYCEKDETGRPVIKNNNYSIIEDKKSEFGEKVEKLKEENKDIVKQTEDKSKQFLELLKEEVDIELSRFKLNELPKEMIGQDLELLYDLIDEE